MPNHPVWTGFLKLSLVSVPVQAYTASESGGTVRLNHLHAKCKSRVRHKRVCPICGEVPEDEIVKGYEVAKGEYVVIDLDELEKLRPKNASKVIRIDTFVHRDAIDPIHFSNVNYFLVPGATDQKPYAMRFQAMVRAELRVLPGSFCTTKTTSS